MRPSRLRRWLAAAFVAVGLSVAALGTGAGAFTAAWPGPTAPAVLSDATWV